MYDRVWDGIGDVARLAPTPHNTQPFRIVPRGPRNADLVVVRDRLLPREDHGNLYMAGAFGIFATTVEHAARYMGRDVAVDVVPLVDVANLHAGPRRVVVGRATLGEPAPVDPAETRWTMRLEPRDGLLALLEARRTSRLPYHDQPVLGASTSALAYVAAVYGHRFLSFDDPRLVERILRLNADAVVDNLQLGDEREEIRGWYRYGETPDRRRRAVGAADEPAGVGAAQRRSRRRGVYMLPGFRQFARRIATCAPSVGTRHDRADLRPVRASGPISSTPDGC